MLLTRYAALVVVSLGLIYASHTSAEPIARIDPKLISDLEKIQSDSSLTKEEKSLRGARRSILLLTEAILPKFTEAQIKEKISKIGTAVRELHKLVPPPEIKKQGRTAFAEYTKRTAMTVAHHAYDLLGSLKSEDLEKIIPLARLGAFFTSGRENSSGGYFDEYYFAELVVISSHTLLDFRDGLTPKDLEFSTELKGRRNESLRVQEGIIEETNKIYSMAENSVETPQETELVRALYELVLVSSRNN